MATDDAHLAWTFSLVPGFFTDLDEVARRAPDGIVTTQPSFGLRPPPDGVTADPQLLPWPRFLAHVKALNRDAPAHVAYKVLLLTRHGFGLHNKKIAEVGTAEWDRYWSLLDGDGTETWFDAVLADTGVEQVRQLSGLWIDAMARDGLPPPDSVYSSPLTRCLQTTRLMLAPALPPPLVVLVQERLRETYTLHTCDMRRPRARLAADFPEICFEPGFAELDPWRGRVAAETGAEHARRKHHALAHIWDTDAGELLALTMHSGAIRALFAACGGRPFHLREGSTVAVLVRGEGKGRMRDEE